MRDYLEGERCAFCHGKTSIHSLGEGRTKRWCDECGSNTPDAPPCITVVVEGRET